MMTNCVWNTTRDCCENKPLIRYITNNKQTVNYLSYSCSAVASSLLLLSCFFMVGSSVTLTQRQCRLITTVRVAITEVRRSCGIPDINRTRRALYRVAGVTRKNHDCARRHDPLDTRDATRRDATSRKLA